MELKGSNIFKLNHYATEDTVVNQGGTSSTKTDSILRTLILKATQEQGVLISVVSESLPHLKRGALRDFLNILKSEGAYDENNYNKTDRIIKFGKSEIEFFSADMPDKLRGARRDYLFINECNNISYDAFTQLETRTRKQVFLDYNPTASFWCHTHVLPRANVKYITSTYKDNPFLDEKVISRIELRKNDANWWRVYGLGQVGMTEGVIFPNINIVDEIPTEYNWLCYGLDFGFTNDPTALIAVYKVGDDIYLDQIIYETGLTNSDINAKVTTLDIPECIADSAEPKSIEDLARMGWNVLPAKKGKDSINSGIDLMKRYKINITKRSVDLIKEFRNYQWKQDRDGEYINQPIDYFNHGIDAVRYVALLKMGVEQKSWIDDMY